MKKGNENEERQVKQCPQGKSKTLIKNKNITKQKKRK